MYGQSGIRMYDPSFAFDYPSSRAFYIQNRPCMRLICPGSLCRSTTITARTVCFRWPSAPRPTHGKEGNPIVVWRLSFAVVRPNLTSFVLRRVNGRPRPSNQQKSIFLLTCEKYKLNGICQDSPLALSRASS